MKFFPDLKIFQKATEIWQSMGKSNPAQIDRRALRTFDIPIISSSPEAPSPITKETKILRRNAESDPGALGSTEAAPWQHRLNSNYIRPEENYRFYIAADVAIAINPLLRAALRNFAYGAGGLLQGIKILSAPRKKRVQADIDSFCQRVNLKLYLPEIVRRWLLYGNGYVQHQLMKELNKIKIKQLLWMPVYGMIRCSNDLDQFDDINHAFEQQDVSTGVYRKHQFVDAFPEWAINHFRLFAVPGEPYGHSLIESAIYSGANERYVDAMLELYWQSKYSRPVDIHKLMGPGSGGDRMPATQKQIDDHLNRVAKARQTTKGKETPRDIVIADGDITRLPGDPNTDKIADKQMLAEQILAEVYQSAQMISSDAYANVGVLVERFRQFYGNQEQIINIFCRQFRDTINFELGLLGYDPDSIEYEFIFGQNLLIQDLIVVNREARSDYKEGHIDKDTRLKIAGQLYRVDPATIREALDREEEEQKRKLQAEQEKLPSNLENPNLTDRQPPDPSTETDSDLAN